MAFVPTGPTREAISWNELFGSAEKNSAALKGAKAFRDAAKAGKFAVDPDQAKKALDELHRAEASAELAFSVARSVARDPEIGGSDFAQTAKKAYREGGESAADAVMATIDVLRLYREGIDAAMKNYRGLDDDAAGRFRGSE